MFTLSGVLSDFGLIRISHVINKQSFSVSPYGISGIIHMQSLANSFVMS